MKKLSMTVLMSSLSMFTFAQQQASKIEKEGAAVYQTKSIFINAAPEAVWKILTSIEQWPNWNSHISKVATPEPLSLNTAFSWKNNGTSIHSKVYKFDVEKNLGWTGKAFGAKAVHHWTFEAKNGSTKLTVEETMDGWLVSLFKRKMNKVLAEDMEYWLIQLKKESEKK